MKKKLSLKIGSSVGNSNLIRKKLAILIQKYHFYVGLRKKFVSHNFFGF